jgi:hypothetical protein
MDCPKCQAKDQTGTRCGTCGASLIARSGDTASYAKPPAIEPPPKLTNADPTPTAPTPTKFSDILRFRAFVTPLYIEIIFWIGILAVFVNVVLWSIGIGHQSGVAGFLVFLVGLPLSVIGWRITCELLIIVFRIYEELRRNNSHR